MTPALLLLAAATPDAAFDAYAKCASAAAASYAGPKDSLEAVAGRVDAQCAADRTTLLEAAPDKRQAAEWLRTTGIMAVSEHVPGLPSTGSEPQGEQKAAPVAISRYPKLDAYRACATEQAAKTEAERRGYTAEAVANDAVGRCEPQLKAAADELVAEMRQPALRQQVTYDFRRRAIAELVQAIETRRAGGKAAAE